MIKCRLINLKYVEVTEDLEYEINLVLEEIQSGGSSIVSVEMSGSTVVVLYENHLTSHFGSEPGARVLAS